MKHFLFLLLLAALSYTVLFVYVGNSKKEAPDHEYSFLSKFTVGPEDEHSKGDVQVYEKIEFTGDIMLGRNVEKLSREFGDSYPYLLLPPKATHTVLVGNFESSIPQKHVPTPNGTFAFSVDAQFLSPLKAYGFDYVSLANNHSYDYGVESFTHAMESLTSAGIRSFGDQKNQASSTIEYTELKGSTVALIGLYAVYVRPTEVELQMLLNRASQHSDIQFVYVHWGDEYELVHNSFQEDLAHDAIDLGADAVIGHHPHVVQDIEFYKNTPIFYSLGNFIFDQYFSDDVQTGLVVSFSQDKANNFFSLKGVTSIGTRSQPRMMSQEEQSLFLKKLAERSDLALHGVIEKGLLELTK